MGSDGGIEIYVSAEKPAGVPTENWLPINRKDQGIDIILRVYAPDLEKMKTWQAPKAEKTNKTAYKITSRRLTDKRPPVRLSHHSYGSRKQQFF
jgi:hypothetical protein